MNVMNAATQNDDTLKEIIESIEKGMDQNAINKIIKNLQTVDNNLTTQIIEHIASIVLFRQKIKKILNTIDGI